MINNFRLTQKWSLLVLLIAGITVLHYITDQGKYFFHVFYGELYFLPIVLAGFWFGLHRALLVSVTITICYFPFIFYHWQSFSSNDLDRIFSLFLYNGLAVLTGVLRDRETSSRKKLLQAENLASMGRSLAAVAHDMKTPLVLIGGFAKRILKKMDADDPARMKLTLIIKETEKMESMTKDMLDFSKPLALNRIKGNCNTILENSLAKVNEAALRKNVAIQYGFIPDMKEIYFDSLRLEQMVVNLVLNAVEASPAGSTVTVNLSQSSEGLVLDVEDKGCGIPFTKKHKVFDPFFTTKKEGTGLGLPIVKKIVEAHGWSLQILDNAGGGTIFRVNLTAT